MTLVLPIGTANTRFIWQVTGLVDPMGFSIATVSTPEVTAAQIADRMSSAWTTTALGAQASWNDEFLYVGTQTTLMLSSGPVIAQFNENDQGTATADSPSVNSTILVSKQTALGGRKNRGRFNIPSGRISESDVNSAGFILASGVGALQAGATAFYNAMITLEVQPVLLHSNPADAPTVITGFAVSSQMATQRLRMR